MGVRYLPSLAGSHSSGDKASSGKKGGHMWSLQVYTAALPSTFGSSTAVIGMEVLWGWASTTIVAQALLIQVQVWSLVPITSALIGQAVASRVGPSCACLG